MNDEELRSNIEQIKAQVKAKEENKGKSDDEIDELVLDAFFKSYTEGEISKEDLGAIAEEMGYEFTEDFDQEEEVTEEGAPAEDLTKEQLEETRTMEPGESKEEFKDKIEDVKDGEVESEGEEEDSEEEERRKASELWKMDLSKKD